MKKFKKLVAMIMALGMVSSMGISVYADTIGDSQKTYYTGDVNLDGKVNVIDVILLKKMILGLIDMQEMYIDGDTLKLVEDTQPVINTVYCYASDINLEDNSVTVYVFDSHEELTLYVDDNTTYGNGYGEISSLDLEDLALYLNIIDISVSYNEDTNVITNISSLVTCDKPVIYLYPTEETEVNVTLDLNGVLTCTYPKYENGWTVTAEPDGTLYDADGNEYYCLYWEGVQNVEYDLSKGFVVKGEDTADFLREKLLYMGLTAKEANEFIIYWLPKMENNAYNLITFQDDIYTENAELDITPTPDSILRIFMAYQPLDEYIEIEEQELLTFDRIGFTVVEWGGTEIVSN